MNFILKGILSNCRQATLLSVKKKEGRLSGRERIKLFIHMLYCDACKRFVRQSDVIDKKMQGFHEHLNEHPEHHLSSQLKESIQKQINQLHKRP